MPKKICPIMSRRGDRECLGKKCAWFYNCFPTLVRTPDGQLLTFRNTAKEISRAVEGLGYAIHVQKGGDKSERNKTDESPKRKR